MESFDNFNWLLSLNDIVNRISPNDEKANASMMNPVIHYRRYTITMHNYYAVMHIYQNYIRKYGEDFIREQSRRLKNKIAKEWILYALDKYHYILEDRNNDFLNEIEDLIDRLGITSPNIIDIFKSHMPYLFNVNIFKFAYDNIDSPNFNYFYLLLIWFYEGDYPIKPHLHKYQTCKNKDKCKRANDCKIRNINKNLCLYDEERYGKDYSFTQELTDFQKEIVINFLHFAPQEIKNKALVKLYESFKQINQTNIFEEKLSLSFDKFLCNKENPLTGDFYIPWSKVEFYNKFYLISHPNVPSNISQPYKIDDKHSRIAFDDIKKLFSKRLPPIHVEAKNGKIIKVLNEANLYECIRVMEHEVNAKIEKKDSIDKEKVEKKILTKDEAKSMILSKDFKSQYLNSLCTQQIENYKVICCIEHRINANGSIHDEYSFIFTIKESKKKLYLAYENANNSRCTYILPVRNGTWKESIDNIYNFFASNEVNKRQQMASKLIDLKLPGNYEYKRVYHKDYSSWYYTIQEILRGY